MVSVNYYGGKLRVHRRVNSSSDDEPQPKRKRGITNEGKYTRNVIRKSRVNSTDNKAVRTRAQSASEMQAIESVPETSTENVMDLVVAVANVLGFRLETSMIGRSTIPGGSGPQNIIVKSCCLFDMEEVRRLAIRRKGFSASNLGFSSQGNVYVNLLMTRQTRILWTNTRKLKDELQYTFAWITSAGKIYLRKSDRQRPILIEDLSDLERLRSTATGGPAAGENGDTAPLTSDTS
ncbi:hypothetical protein J6590_103425 [Homalodisca vitripennis]|nr:hypothetical protein J6590_103425 [Homalodisca vitripennis]